MDQDRPRYLAVDNIFELAPDKKALIRFLERLPQGVKLVQVTGGLHQRSLVRLAREHGLTFNPHDPNDEAEVCAWLADLGTGCEVSLFEDITKIKVSRARSLGRGGWGQNRYRRKVHGAVRTKSREIEDILEKDAKEGKFTYSTRIAKGFGGYVRCEFTVNARRGEVPIHPSSGADAQIMVKSVVRDKIKYIPLKQKERRSIIVGIDPGTTVGVVIRSLDSELLLSKSFRGISHNEVVKLIAEYGKPAIVVTDVTPTPAAVEKIRRSFSATISTPGTQISYEEKIEMARPFGYSNDHERDSLAAALYAAKNYRNLFRRIDKKVPPELDRDMIKLNVIKGDSIGEAIEKIARERRIGKSKDRSAPLRQKHPLAKDDEQYRKMAQALKQKNAEISDLQEDIRELKMESASKDATISMLETKINHLRDKNYRKMLANKEIGIRNSKISRFKKELRRTKHSLKRLRSQIKKLKQIRKIEIKGKGVPVKIISSFKKEAIDHTKERYGIKKDDVVYLQDPGVGGKNTASILVDHGVCAVIIPKPLTYAAEEVFFEADVPVLKDLSIQRVDDFAIVTPEALRSAIHKWEQWAEMKRKAEEAERLKLLVDEYRSDRRHGVVWLPPDCSASFSVKELVF